MGLRLARHKRGLVDHTRGTVNGSLGLLLQWSLYGKPKIALRMLKPNPIGDAVSMSSLAFSSPSMFVISR